MAEDETRLSLRESLLFLLAQKITSLLVIFVRFVVQSNFVLVSSYPIIIIKIRPSRSIFIIMAEPTRLELATSAVTGQRSNQLSYDSTEIILYHLAILVNP